MLLSTGEKIGNCENRYARSTILNQNDGLSAAYELVPMYCFSEFENVIEPNYDKEEYYCREILDKEIKTI